MRVTKRALPAIGVVPETLDDIWHLEKIIEKGDLVTARSERRFKTESGKSERKTVTVKITVEGIEYHRDSRKLRLLGTIVEGYPAEYVAIGMHHTIEVLPGVMITVTKESWKKYQLDRLKHAVKASKKPKLLIVVMDDEEAEVALLRDFGLEKKGTIRSGKSGKAFPAEKKSDYFDQIAGAISGAEKVVVAGPGFTKDNFAKWLEGRQVYKKCVFVDIGGAGSPGMQELLKKGVIEKVVKDARAAVEASLVEEVIAKIPTDNAAYGIAAVEEALDYGAAEKLLLADSYFSDNRDIAEKLLQKAEQINAEVHIISTEHESGERLEHLGGVAATLRFKTG
ncbi:MAG: mRNA surveillance protein pelota [Candidatus Diapherotrites archaeon]|nr:mRNA surveillance protein pelota [Candidatus Diapherotrites archaeon]